METRGELCVHCREVVHSSECPLSEVSLYVAVCVLAGKQGESVAVLSPWSREREGAKIANVSCLPILLSPFNKTQRQNANAPSPLYLLSPATIAETGATPVAGRGCREKQTRPLPAAQDCGHEEGSK